MSAHFVCCCPQEAGRAVRLHKFLKKHQHQQLYRGKYGWCCSTYLDCCRDKWWQALSKPRCLLNRVLFSCSVESSRPPAATVTPPAQKDATQKDGPQPQPSKQDRKSQQKKATPPQKAGVKKPQPQGQGPAAGRGRGRDNPRGRAGPGRAGRSGERPGDRSGRGRENGSQHFPPSRHGTPPLSGGRPAVL